MTEVGLPNPDELHEHSVSHFSRRVARATATFAVVLAIAALGGNLLPFFQLPVLHGGHH